jgi:hypothetical protein
VKHLNILSSALQSERQAAVVWVLGQGDGVRLKSSTIRNLGTQLNCARPGAPASNLSLSADAERHDVVNDS